LRDDVLTRWGETTEKAADQHDHRLSRVGIVPDHLHLSMSCPQSESPAVVALSYMNNLAHNSGMQEVFKYSYYVGTIGEYNLSVFE
jgi:REP element-mobilizing transposase RayT